MNCLHFYLTEVITDGREITNAQAETIMDRLEMTMKKIVLGICVRAYIKCNG